MAHRQKHKNKKRPRGWHRSSGEQPDLPATGAPVDLSLSAPESVRRKGPSGQNRKKGT